MSDSNQTHKLQIVHTALWAVKESYVGMVGLEMQLNGEFKPLFTIVSLPDFKMKVRFNDNSFVILDRLVEVVIRHPYPPERTAIADVINDLDELKATAKQVLSEHADIFEKNKLLVRRYKNLEEEYNTLARLVSFCANALESAPNTDASNAEKNGQMRLISRLLTDAVNERDISNW